MILGFKPQFKPLIISGQKIHTIRPDKSERWREGMEIHFATGVRTKDYNCFNQEIEDNKDYPHGLTCWKSSLYSGRPEILCTSVQEVVIQRKPTGSFLWVDGKELWVYEDMLEFAINDGFESAQEMFHWFQKTYYPKQSIWSFKGRLIHWTQKRY